jgi:metallophosphoesterase (TIGR00282 family)
MKVLFLGEIVGKPGITTIKSLKAYRESNHIDLVVANGEGTTNGFGLGKAHALQLSKLGIDILTGGEKIYFKLDMVDFLSKTNWILRPANYPQGDPGRGLRILDIGGKTVVLINLLGTSGFTRVHLNNPFLLVQTIIAKTKEEHPDAIFLVQFHASTTAEKQTMKFLLDGKAAAVIGTHTKVMSADASVTENGTAYITDNGRCGSQLGIGGFANEVELRKFLTGIPERSQECWERLEMQGVLVEIDVDGKATSIEYVHIPVEKPQTEVSHV